MQATSAAFRYYSSIIGVRTLTNRIRESSWDIRDLIAKINYDFRAIDQNLNRLKKRGTFNDAFTNLSKTVPKLSSELRSWMFDLKRVNFYDSAILYLYLRYLVMLYEECRKRTGITFPKEKEKTKKLVKRSKEVEKEMKKMMGIKEDIIKAIRMLKVGANRELTRCFNLAHLIVKLKSLEKLNRYIKIKAINIKKHEEDRARLMNSLSTMNEKDIKAVIRVFEDVIKDVEKDVKFCNEMMIKLDNKVDNLKKKITGIKNILKQKQKGNADAYTKFFETSLNNLEAGIRNDLKGICMNALKEGNVAALTKL